MAATYRLSPADTARRTHIGYCLCFPCGTDDAIVQRIAANLMAAVKRVATHLPVLAGQINYVPKTRNIQSYTSSRRGNSAGHAFDEEQCDRLEVSVSMQQVFALEPTVKVLKHDEFPHTYDSLVKSKMPADLFTGDDCTALMPFVPGSHDSTKSNHPVFAVQANFLTGGVIVSLLLDHSIGDVQTMATILRHMSISEEILPARKLTSQVLHVDALERSMTHELFSRARGATIGHVEHVEYDLGTEMRVKCSIAPNRTTATILSFSLAKLRAVTTMINERYSWCGSGLETQCSDLDCLMTILWKAAVRACWPHDRPAQGEGQISTVIVPLDDRPTYDASALTSASRGSERMLSYSAQPIVRLALPFDVSSLATTAKALRASIKSANGQKMPYGSPETNRRQVARRMSHVQAEVDELWMTNWTELPIGEEAGLSLGLGSPGYGRKLGRGTAGHECVLLPWKEEQGVWEVMVQLEENAIERLLEDPGLGPFVVHAA